MKKIALFLLIAGFISFLVGINSLNNRIALDIVSKESKAQEMEHKLPLGYITSQDFHVYTGLLMASIILIGVGAYLFGVGNRKNKVGSLTLDFTSNHSRKYQ